MRSNERQTDLEVLQFINSYSPSMCLAKWYNATIWLGSGMTTSCHHPLPHKIPEGQELTVNPKLLHNTAQKKKERELMQQGQRPAGCEYCWKIEDLGKDAISDRVYKTVIYKKEDLDAAFTSPADKDVDLKTLEIAFDRTCQFACSYCNPAFSSTWVKDIKKNGPYQGLISDGRNHFTHPHDSSQLYKFGEENPYVTAFHKWWESDLHSSLNELRITGGEPLMSGETWKLLDWFKLNRGKSKTKLAINSNLGEEVDVDRLLDTIDDMVLDIYTSNESIELQAEYIRDGLKWDKWLENVIKLIESKKIRQVHVMCTINALCLESLTAFLDLLLLFRATYGKDTLPFTLNILRFPSFQSALVLPDDIKQRHVHQLTNWLDTHRTTGLLHTHEVNHTQRLIDYLDIAKTPHSEAFELSALRKDFKNFYTQYDLRRNKNFEKTFKNLKDWYNSL